MPRPKLTKPPTSVDDLGRPCFPVAQDRGLWDTDEHELLDRQVAAGYCAATDRPAIRSLASEVRQVARGRLLNVLEIGGTTGHFFDEIQELAKGYVNIEPAAIAGDPHMQARLADERYQAIRCSAEDLPLPDSSFDLALALASLDHIPDADRALAEIRRVLRPGGHLIVALGNRGSWWKRALRNTRYLKNREAKIAREHYRQWTADECETALARHFSVTRVSTRTFFPYMPLVWRALLPVADAIGPHLAPRSGAIIVAHCVKSRQEARPE